ncbi:MAG TPA: TetR/AcrR family transcriptional regulator [Terriglobales bacterium]|nr:TetR/AcrR family transcriptional regulator [Terriglobales bacterium]
MPKTVLPAHQERSRKTLARLLQAAVETLNRDGLEGATIPRIAARAGLTPGAIYRRFPDKDALLREVCLRALESNYRHTSELLNPEKWNDKSLADICGYVIDTTLKGHAQHRGLLRALTLFTLQHPDASFVRRSEELEWKTFQLVSEMLLTRRDEIRHPDPDSAIRCAMLMIGVVAQGVMVLPKDPRHFSRLLPDAENQVQRELPRMVLQYLGIGK